MQNQLELLNLGFFNIDLPAGWDAHFFPSIEFKLRLVKDDSIVIFEYFLAPESESESILGFFYQENISELQRNVNGVVFEEDYEDRGYEVLVENNHEFRKYFFHSIDRLIFRLTLTGTWEPQDEDEIRTVLKSISSNEISPELTSEIVLAPFEFEYENWFRVGAMYSKRGGQ